MLGRLYMEDSPVLFTIVRHKGDVLAPNSARTAWVVLTTGTAYRAPHSYISFYAYVHFERRLLLRIKTRSNANRVR